ncbi:MAG: hypothetical protein KDC95_24355, partial [Planctomycetes bacterium]|nr:hypothetical protein [Planctomycetota bacterium]
VIYERDVNICHKITTIIIRSNSSDPYTSNDPNTLLNQFRNHWNSSQGGVVRDTAHMFTGRSASQTIGIAYLSVICNRSSAYGISWTTYTSNYQSRVGLTAHELGHNWGAGHCCGSCSGCNTCNIMCPCIRGCSGNITNFGSSSIAAITSHRNSRGCLDDGCNGGGTNDPTCADFQAVKLRCKADGTLKPKVVMFTEDFDGKTVTVTIDGSFD